MQFISFIPIALNFPFNIRIQQSLRGKKSRSQKLLLCLAFEELELQDIASHIPSLAKLNESLHMHACCLKIEVQVHHFTTGCIPSSIHTSQSVALRGLPSGGHGCIQTRAVWEHGTEPFIGHQPGKSPYWAGVLSPSPHHTHTSFTNIRFQLTAVLTFIIYHQYLPSTSVQ